MSEMSHATMCGIGSSGSCFVPWCTCSCHSSSHEEQPREEAPWSIKRDGDTYRPWTVTHPRVHEHRSPRISDFRTHAEALAFVLAQPEVRRRTSKPVDPLLRSADA